MEENVPPLCEELFTNVAGCPIQFSMPICPEKERVRRKIEDHGGSLTSMTGGLNTIRLVPPGMKNSSSSFDIFSTRYIDDCVEQEKLLNLSRYRIGKSHFTEKIDVNDIMMGKNSWKDCEQQREELGEEVSDLEDDCDLPRRQKQNKSYPVRRDYTHQERRAILHYIIDNRKYNDVKGRFLWQEMEKAEVCIGRTWGSMKEHFRKNIVNNLHMFKLTEKEIKRLTAPFAWGKYEENRYFTSDDTDESEHVGESEGTGRSPKKTSAGGNHRKRDKHRPNENKLPSLSGVSSTVDISVDERPKDSPCRIGLFVDGIKRESQKVNRIADRQLPEEEAESDSRRSPTPQAQENQSTEIGKEVIERETDAESDVTVIPDSEEEKCASIEMNGQNETGDDKNRISSKYIKSGSEPIHTEKSPRNQSSEGCASRKPSENVPYRHQLPDVICSTSMPYNSEPFDVVLSSKEFLDCFPTKDLPPKLEQGINNIVANAHSDVNVEKGAVDKANITENEVSGRTLPSARDIEEMNEVMFSQSDFSLPSPSRSEVVSSPPRKDVSPPKQWTRSGASVKSPTSPRTISVVKSPSGHGFNVRSSPYRGTRSVNVERRKSSEESSDSQSSASSQETEVFESCQDHTTVTSKPKLNVVEPVVREKRFDSNLVEPFLRTDSSSSDSSLSSDKSTVIFPDTLEAKRRVGGRAKRSPSKINRTFSVKCNADEDSDTGNDSNHRYKYGQRRRPKKRHLKDTHTSKYAESLPSQPRGGHSSSSDSEIDGQTTSDLKILSPEPSSSEGSIVLRRDTRAKIPKMMFQKEIKAEKDVQNSLAVYDIPTSESDDKIEYRSDSETENFDDPAELKDNFTGKYDREYSPQGGCQVTKRTIRLPYSTEEDVVILKYIIKHKSQRKVCGRGLWQDMEKRVLPSRSWQSLKERFRMRIAHRLPLYVRYGIPEVALKDLAKLTQSVEPAAKEPEPSRRSYTRKEDLWILKFITENKRHSQVGGKMLWTLMSESVPQLSGRTWLSLKERFRRTIMKNINDYGLSKDDIRRFLKRKSMQKSSKSIKTYFSGVKKSKRNSESEDSLTESDDYGKQPQCKDERLRSSKINKSSRESMCKEIIEKHLSKWPQPSASGHVSNEPSKEQSSVANSSKANDDVKKGHDRKRKLYTPVVRLDNLDLANAHGEKTVKGASKESPVSKKVVETVKSVEASEFTKDISDVSKNNKHNETADEVSDEIPLDVVHGRVQLRHCGDSRHQKEGSPNVTSSTDQNINQATVNVEKISEAVKELEENEVDSTQGTQQVVQTSEALLYIGGNQSPEPEYSANVDKYLSPPRENEKLLAEVANSHEGSNSLQQAQLDLTSSQTSCSGKDRVDCGSPNTKNIPRYLRSTQCLDVRNISPRPRSSSTVKSTTVRSRLRRKPLRKTKN